MSPVLDVRRTRRPHHSCDTAHASDPLRPSDVLQTRNPLLTSDLRSVLAAPLKVSLLTALTTALPTVLTTALTALLTAVMAAGPAAVAQDSTNAGTNQTPVAVANQTPVAATNQTDDPRVRLVVLLMIDQFRADYLTRFAPHYAPGGFRRLMREGAYFCNSYYSYGHTATGPGHATVVTGRLPRQHGIVANTWFLDPNLNKGQDSVYDPKVRLVGLMETDGKGVAGASPRALMGATLGDQMKLADARTRVFSLAIKDRAAIFMGGKRPDGVCWFDVDSGRFISSTYYTNKLPAWLEKFNNDRWVDCFIGQSWERVLPEAAYAGCHPNQTGWLVQLAGLSPEFPHSLPPVGDARPDKRFYEALISTPFGNDLTFEVARRLLENEALGQNPSSPDLLCISLSANDIGGHLFGPESQEVLDFCARTDRQIAAFLDILDERIGTKNYLIAVSADHGVTTIAPLARKMNLRSGRIDTSELRDRINAALVREFGPLSGGRTYVTGATQPWIYLDREVAQRPAEQRRPILSVAAEAIRSVEGVEAVYTADELSGPCPSRDDLDRWLAWRCFHPRHSGELYVKFDPYFLRKKDDLAGHSGGTSHDRHVPILLMGPGVMAGRYYQPTDPIDIAPTLATLLGIEPPQDAVGQVLHWALEARARR